MHHHDAAHTLALLLGGVHDIGASRQGTGVHAEEGQLTHEGIDHDLERQGGEGSIVRGLALQDDFLVVGIGALDGLNVQGAGHVVNHVVQQGLNALVAVRGAAADGVHGAVDGGLTDGGTDLLNRDLLALEELLHQLVVGLGDLLDHLVVVLLRQLEHILGNLFLADVLALVVVVDLGLHGDQVDDAAEGFFLTDGQLNRHRIGMQAILHHVNDAEEVSAGDVHLVDVGHTGDLVGLGLLPHGLGLGLNAALGAEDGHSAVQHAQGTLNLNGEVHVTGGVNDVDAVGAVLVGGILGIVPHTSGSRRSDGDAALLLLDHPVHGSRAFMGLTNTMGLTGVEQDALGGRGLTGVDMSHDTDVAQLLKGMTARHKFLLLSAIS